MSLVTTQVEALSISDAEPLWETGIDPNPWSDHTRLTAVFAQDQNWLYFDWTLTDQHNPDIYLWDGTEAVPVVNTAEPEIDPRVFYYNEQFYLTYEKTTTDLPEGSAYAIFLRTSQDGITFGPETELYSPESNYIESHDILFAKGWFYLAYNDLAYGDIFVVKSRNLVDWTSPVCAAGTPDLVDFAPALCWARGKIWLAWDYTANGEYSTVWITSSRNGVDWSDPIEIPPTEPYHEAWGPFSLIFSSGQFILATRARQLGTYPFRICYTTSRDGVTWSPYTLVTSPSPEPPNFFCVEKGPVVYPFAGASNSQGQEFAIAFKRLQWYTDSSGDTLFDGGVYRVIISF